MDFQDSHDSVTFDEDELKITEQVRFLEPAAQNKYYEKLVADGFFTMENLLAEPLGKLFLSMFLQNKKSVGSGGGKGVQIEESFKDFRPGKDIPSTLTTKKFDAFRKSKLFREYVSFKSLDDDKATFDDFELCRTLGVGALGHVLLCYHKSTGKLCVVKRMDKRVIKKMNAVKNVLVEAKILSLFRNNPFITRPLMVFHNAQDTINVNTIVNLAEVTMGTEFRGGYLNIVMEACMGGSLEFQIENQSGFDEETAKFYAAEILVGLEFMHKKRIIYRDLKPENVLLRASGHCTLADMGTAEKISEGKLAKRKIGTPFYWAPEVCKDAKNGYDFACDLFTYGVVIWEMITGKNPFKEISESKGTSASVATVKLEPEMPDSFSSELQDLLTMLLKKNPRERPTIEVIQNHDWFVGTDWDEVKSQELEPPLVPDPSAMHFLNEDEIPEVKDDAWPYLEEKDHEPYNMATSRNTMYMQSLYAKAIQRGSIKISPQILKRRLSRTPSSLKRRSIVGGSNRMLPVAQKESKSANASEGKGNTETVPEGGQNNSKACMIL